MVPWKLRSTSAILNINIIKLPIYSKNETALDL
jgi:hypothetical protein